MHAKATEYAAMAEREANRYHNEPVVAAQFETGYLRGVVDKLCRDIDELNACLEAAHARLRGDQDEEKLESA